MKNKIAITIDSPILKLIDRMVKTKKSTRSQILSDLVLKGMNKEKLEYGFILIKKKNLEILEKKINGKRLIDHHKHFFKSAGIKKIFLVSDSNQKEKYGLEIIKDSGFGTESALKPINLLKLSSPFVLINGDTFVDFDLSDLIAFFLSQNNPVVISLNSFNHPELFYSIYLSGDKIVDIVKEKNPKTYIIHSGVAVINPIVIDNLSSGNLEDNLYRRLCLKSQISGYFNSGEIIPFELFK